MDNFSGFTIFNAVIIVILMVLLIKDLYTLSHNGKVIVKSNKKGSISIIWVGALIFWCFLLWSDIRLYNSYHQDSVFTNIFTGIFWIEISISNLIKSYISSQIREMAYINLVISISGLKYIVILGYYQIQFNSK